MKGGLWGWWVGMMGGGKKGRGGMVGMELQRGDSKHPLFVHMEGGRGVYFYPVSYRWIDPARKT